MTQVVAGEKHRYIQSRISQIVVNYLKSNKKLRKSPQTALNICGLLVRIFVYYLCIMCIYLHDFTSILILNVTVNTVFLRTYLP